MPREGAAGGAQSAEHVGASGVLARLSHGPDALRRLPPRRRVLAAMAAGGGLAVAMPPAHAFPLLWLCFPVLLWTLQGARSRWGAFAVGWAFGFGFFVCGLYWIAFALTVDLATWGWLLPVAAAGLPAVLALFIGLATLAWSLLPGTGRGPAGALWLVLLWGAAEVARGTLFTGFPWNLIGYTWSGWLPVMQGVAVLGIYGLSLLTVAAALAPVAAAAATTRLGAVAMLLPMVLVAGIGVWGAARMPSEPVDTVPGVMLRLVQPNISQADKWRPELRLRHLQDYIALSRQPPVDPARPPTHVLWPETAVPFHLDLQPEAATLIGRAAPPDGLVLTGVPRATVETPRRYFNSFQAVAPDGTIVAIYDKAHLVPFGEYMPLRRWVPFEAIAAGSTDYSAGPGPQTVTVAGLPPVSPLICYEIIFPGAVTAAAGLRPDWMLNLTNDAWYGKTAGPHQHMAISASRAIEQGLPLVRVAGTGLSAVVDPYGRTTARIGLEERGIVDAGLPVAITPPLAARTHPLAGLVGIVAIFTIALYLTRRKR